MVAEISLLLFLSNLVDSENNFKYLWNQLNDIVLGQIIRTHLKALVKRGLIKLIIRHERSIIEIDSYGNDMDRLLFEAAVDTVSYRIGRRRIYIPEHYRNRHNIELTLPDLPCLVSQGGFIRGTVPRMIHENLFPIELIQIQIQGSTAQAEHVMLTHAHKYGPPTTTQERLVLNQPSDLQQTPPPPGDDDWGASYISPRDLSPEPVVPEKKTRSIETQTDVSV